MAFPPFGSSGKKALARIKDILPFKKKHSKQDDTYLPSGKAAKPQNNRINMRVSSTGSKSFEMHLPNLFRKNITADASYRTDGSCAVRIHRPCWLKNMPGTATLKIERTEKSFNNKDVCVHTVEASCGADAFKVSLGVEQIKSLMVLYMEHYRNILGFEVTAKCGVSRTGSVLPFFKGMMSRGLSFIYGPFFIDSNVRVGRIFGQTNLTEKFFLGTRIRGYKENSISPLAQNKKIGAKSFIELRNRIGVAVKGIEAFVFADTGVCSTKGMMECCTSLREFGNNNCIGKSVGCGLTLKNNKSISLIYSIPFTDNKEFERYSCGIDVLF